MKENARLFMAAVLTVVLVVSGCSGANNGNRTDGNSSEKGESSEKPKPVRYVVPDVAPPDMERIERLVSEKMQADGYNLELDVIFIPRDVLDERVNIMLSTGEPIELIHIMENVKSSAHMVSRGLLQPLDELIDEYGPVLKERFSDSLWQSTKTDGLIYTVPADWKAVTSDGGENGYLPLRFDMYEEYHIPLPTNNRELLDSLIELKEKWGEPDAYYWPEDGFTAMTRLLRDLDSWPFHVDFSDELMFVNEDRIEAWFTTDEFKQTSAFMREAYLNDLIHPDYLSLPFDQKRNIVASGVFLAGGDGMYTRRDELMEKWPNYMQHSSLAEGERLFLRPEKPFVMSIPVLNAQGVPVTSPHPEAGIQFLNWLYEKQENHDLFMFGIEGEHYNVIDDHRIETINNAAGEAIYQYPFWNIGYRPWSRLGPNAKDYEIDYRLNELDNVVPSRALGFKFNPDPVSTQYKNVLAQIPAVMYPIKYGFFDYDEHYPRAIQTLKDAGLDAIVEEYKQQFAKWESVSK